MVAAFSTNVEVVRMAVVWGRGRISFSDQLLTQCLLGAFCFSFPRSGISLIVYLTLAEGPFSQKFKDIIALSQGVDHSLLVIRLILVYSYQYT